MTKKKTTPRISFESAMKRLEEIVQTLEREEITLEDSLALFQEGMDLSIYCRGMLKETEAKIRKLVENSSGGFHIEPGEEE
jgi:exodeoxyribonuclease VII small subunit